MDGYIDLVKTIAPEVEALVRRRFLILRSVAHLAPVGRRTLAEAMKTGERVIRSELEILRELGLVEIAADGVKLSQRGFALVMTIQPYVNELLGIPRLEQQVAEHLGIAKVLVVPGDSSTDPLVGRDLGRAAARYLQKLVRDGDIIAITGGTTLANVVGMLAPDRRQVTVVPGRGALGERVEIQANTIAARLAQVLGGIYKLLHAPDNLNRQAMDELVRDPRIAEVLELIRKANVLIHGIGDAFEMAARRGSDSSQFRELKEKGAVAEAFGYYFNRQGEIVWQVESIGLRLTDLVQIKTIIAVAGGSEKAQAIAAVAAHHSQQVLITDQGAAEAILQLPKRS
jgi:central glycolytic genes regulator